MKLPYKGIKTGIFVLILLFLTFGYILTAVLGDKSNMTNNTYLIKNNTDDTIFLQDPINYNDQVEEKQKTVIINDSYFLIISPKSEEVFYKEDIFKSFEIASTKWPINDTFVLIIKKDTFNFVYGIKSKCVVEIDQFGFTCTRLIDKSYP